MTTDAQIRAHAALLDETARRVGVDLEDALFSGRIDTPDIEDAVLRCVTCPNPSDCRHWLARNEGQAAHPPVYCRNRRLLAGLGGEDA